ncbi:hypothetical protein AVEN_244789-1 [Araneus ventricosus]|uniref:Uncharacterized protein n=1 Tax=Araneus ventricosus TaxID=182803 RepID=A0A4Y2IFH7_ARAVE|nr:hypothetical protein AVEN_244789-1 [Araneus ventricosus]
MGGARQALHCNLGTSCFTYKIKALNRSQCDAGELASKYVPVRMYSGEVSFDSHSKMGMTDIAYPDACLIFTKNIEIREWLGLAELSRRFYLWRKTSDGSQKTTIA